MIENILCATDGSKISAKAVEFAITLAHRLGVPLTVLTVVSVSKEDAARSPFWDSRVLDAGDAIKRAEFQQVADKAKQVGLSDVTCATANSRNIAEAIAAYADEHKFDHIVMGSHGHTGIERLVLGSTAEGVVAKAHCPVTIVR